MLAPDNELNRWFRSTYEKRYGALPPFSSYHMVQAILGTKAAYEKAKAAAGGKAPDMDQIAAAFEGLSFETPSGTTKMTLGKGHQGIQGTAYGMTKSVQGRLTITNVKAIGTAPNGIPAADSELRVKLPRDGRVLNVLGSPAADLDPDTPPALTPGEAVRAVQDSVGANRPLPRDSGPAGATRAPEYTDGTDVE